MGKLFKTAAFSLLVVCFIITGGGSASAQETDEFTLEEITVTAQKRNENQQKVAISMETLSGEDINKMGQNDIEEILTNVSSVLINKASDGLRVSIRGLSQDQGVFNNVQASTPTVAVNKDGVYTNRSNSGQGLYDIERVEVLFGPQSTMYASSSPGGVVNIITSDPKTDRYSGSASVEYGSFNLLHTSGAANVPVTDTFALRAAFSSSVRDGYLSNGEDDEDSKSARLKALYQPSENFSIVFTGEYERVGGLGIGGVEAFGDQDDVDPWTAANDATGIPKVEDQKKFSAKINWDIDKIGTLTITPSYSERENSNSSIMTMMGTTNKTVNNGTGYEEGVEMRMTSAEDFFFKWIVGFNYYKSKDESESLTYEQGDDDEDVADSMGYRYNNQESKALYTNVTYPITEDFRVTGGIRLNWDENDSYNYEEPGKGGADYTEEVALQKYDSPDYKLGIEYDLAENSMLYSDYSTSYRSQGMSFNDDGVLPPEELDAYTLGIKNRFLNNRLQLNASVYLYDYVNFMASDSMVSTISDDNGNGIWDEGETTVVEDVNAKQVGDARIYGVDLQTTTLLTAKDKLDVSVSYMKKYFTELSFDYYDITNYLGIEDENYKDVEMTNAPNWTINAGYSHDFTFQNGATLTTKLDARYQSSYKLRWKDKTVSLDMNTLEVTIVDQSETRIQEGHHISNFTVIYNNPGGEWTLTGYVKNMEDYAVKRSYIMDNMIIGPPRTFGAVLSVRF